MAVPMIGLLLVGLIGLIVLAIVVFAVMWAVKGFGGMRLGHTMLTCPHCAAETPANLEKCQACGLELR